MLAYVIEHFETYIKEKNIKESILSVNPTSQYGESQEVGHVSTWINERWEEKVWIRPRINFSETTTKEFDIIGPLGRLWKSVDLDG